MNKVKESNVISSGKSMCQLFHDRDMELYDRHSNRPTVSCAKCAREASRPEFVCQSKPLPKI
jgi:hypothetical protein